MSFASKRIACTTSRSVSTAKAFRPRGKLWHQLWRRAEATATAAASYSKDGSSAGASNADGPPQPCGDFEGLPYDRRRKRFGSAQYEQLRTNWSENVPLCHEMLLSPSSLPELCAAVREAQGVVRVVGSAHSFSPLCATDARRTCSSNDLEGKIVPREGTSGTLLSLANMSAIHGINVDADSMSVVVEGGVTVGELCRYLAPRGCALPTTASLPHVTLAGAAATGTHGSGVGNRGLCSWISEMDLVTADGGVVTLARDDPATADLLQAAVVGLGCLGVIARMRVDIVPAYAVAQSVYRVPLEHFLTHFEGLVHSHDSVATFANFGCGVCEAVFVRDHVAMGDDSASLQAAPSLPSPFMIPGAPASTCGELPELQREAVTIYESGSAHPSTGVGTWQDTLHFFMHDSRDDAMPNLTLHAEWFVRLEDAVPALRAAVAASAHWEGWGKEVVAGQAPVVL